MLNDFYIPYVSVNVSAAATSRSRSRLGCKTSRLGLGALRLWSRLGLVSDKMSNVSVSSRSRTYASRVSSRSRPKRSRAHPWRTDRQTEMTGVIL